MKALTEKEMFEASFNRPTNYFSLSPSKQYDIDASLGILDWVGEGLGKSERARFYAHYKKTK